MDTKDYAYFVEVCNTHSISRAAKRLGITPQGLSNAIRRLSSEVGAPLLRTHEGKCEPTPYGLAFLDLCTTSLDAIDVFNRSKETLLFHEQGIVRIGCVTGFLGYYGEDVFDDFCDANANAEACMMFEGVNQDVEQELLDGRIDFAILSEAISPDLMRIPLASDSAFLWVHESHRLANKSSIHIDDLQGETIIVSAEGYNRIDPFPSLFRDTDTTIIYISEMIRIFEYALQRKGLGLTFRNHVEATAGTGVKGIAFPDIKLSYEICYDANRRISDIDVSFLDYMRAQRKVHPAQ